MRNCDVIIKILLVVCAVFRWWRTSRWLAAPESALRRRRCLATDRKRMRSLRCWRHCRRSLRRRRCPTCTTRGTTSTRPIHRRRRLPPPRPVRWRATAVRFPGTGHAGRRTATSRLPSVELVLQTISRRTTRAASARRPLTISWMLQPTDQLRSDNYRCWITIKSPYENF